MTLSSPPLGGHSTTLAEAFAGAARAFGPHDAYVEGSERMSFADWFDRSQRVARRWQRQGVDRGDVVAIMLPPSIDFAVALGAAVLLGAVVTGINTRLGPTEVAAILGRCSPAVLVVEATHTLPPLTGSMMLVERSRIADRAGDRPGDGPVRRPAAASDPAAIIWTSGTTGVPKGAWFDHQGLEAAVRSGGVMTAPFDRRLASTPFAHAGYLGKVWEQLAWGISLVISPTPWTARDMLRLIVEERITVAGGVPTQWAKLLELPDLAGADLSNLRLCVSATAPCPPELVERVVTALGCPLVVRYAMTESPSITGTEPDDPPDVQYRTVGRPQAGVRLDLRDEEGRSVPAGTTGRIHLKSECAMRGYWGDEAATAATLDSDGWLRSGDLGHLDPDGNLILDGRVDDMYIRGGYNVYPLEVEHVLDEHPGVSQASVIGVETPVIGQVGVAFIRPADPRHPPSAEELAAWCRSQVADYKTPDRFVIVDDLPLTPMMKVDKEALRAAASH
ncbi:MAG: acyl--CoA ligase [Acidobacteriota bacterium]|nr:acyl--CoA ligase [Acidobacteriota bacterium]